jgi:hypothetical protein
LFDTDDDGKVDILDNISSAGIPKVNSGGAVTGTAVAGTGGDYLSPAASEFGGFALKASPTTSDVLLIEDAAASGAKKKITIGSLPGGGGSAANGTGPVAGSSGVIETNLTTKGITIDDAVTERAITTLTASAGTITMSLTNHYWYKHTLNADVTLALTDTGSVTNLPVRLDLYCDGTHSITWPSGATLPTTTNQPFLSGVGGLVTVIVERTQGTNYIAWTPALVGTADILADAVTFPKMQNIATDSMIGRTTPGTGDPENLTALPWADTGDVTRAADTTVLTISPNAVTDADLRDSAALSVIGRSANSTGDPGDITAGNDGDVLRRSGTTLGFGGIPAASVTSGQFPIARLALGTPNGSKFIRDDGTLATPTSTLDFGTTLAANDTSIGNPRSGFNNSGGVTQWDAVYLNSSSQWARASSSGGGSVTYPCRGFAIATAATGNATTILVTGTIRHDGWSWTPGGTIYLGGAAGSLTQTAPVATGDIIQQVGYALNAVIMAVEISPTYTTVAATYPQVFDTDNNAPEFDTDSNKVTASTDI